MDTPTSPDTSLVAFMIRYSEALTIARVPQDEARYVYVLLCPETKRVKIGVTDNLETRLTTIRSMSPTRLKLAFSFYTQGAELESFLHRKFDYLRLHGEWFKAKPELMQYLQDLQEQITKWEPNLAWRTSIHQKITGLSESGEKFLDAFDKWYNETVEARGTPKNWEIVRAVRELSKQI